MTYVLAQLSHRHLAHRMHSMMRGTAQPYHASAAGY